MQQLEMNAGRRQLDDMLEPAAGVMRMSADDDDQADQQHELADPENLHYAQHNLKKETLNLRNGKRTVKKL